MGSKELRVFCLMLKLGAGTDISKKQGSASSDRCAQLGRRGATQQAGPPVTSTGSGSKPKLTLKSSIHTFVCSLDLFSLVETGTFPPVLPVICSFIGFVR